MKKSQVAVAAVLASLPVMLFFQNCGQVGAINLTSASSAQKASSNAAATTDALVIDTSSSNGAPISIAPVQQPPAVVSVGSNSSSDQSSAPGSCAGLDISDISLSIKSVNDENFQIIDADKSISLNKQTLKIKALKSFRAKEISLQLNQSGNKVLSLQNEVFALKTPSGQTSGIKVMLDHEISVKEGESLTLNLEISADDQIVSNPKKCIFRPVIRVASMKSGCDHDDNDDDEHDDDRNEHQEIASRR